MHTSCPLASACAPCVCTCINTEHIYLFNGKEIRKQYLRNPFMGQIVLRVMFNFHFNSYKQIIINLLNEDTET